MRGALGTFKDEEDKEKEETQTNPSIRFTNVVDSETNGPVVGPIMPWLNQFYPNASNFDHLMSLLRNFLSLIFEYFMHYWR